MINHKIHVIYILKNKLYLFTIYKYYKYIC